MDSEPRIRVLGEGSVATEPDEGELSITLTELAPLAGAALAEVARRGERLAALLDEMGLDARARSTSGVRVQEEFDYLDGTQRSLGHRASATLVVRLTDLALIGRIIMRAGEDLDARIAGPNWNVSAGHPAWKQAATAAAANAADRAEAYAAGVGMRRGALLTMSEPRDRQMHTTLSRRAAAGPEMPMAAGEHAVTAAIWATFALQTS